jgi:hypothetical protein
LVTVTPEGAGAVGEAADKWVLLEGWCGLLGRERMLVRASGAGADGAEMMEKDLETTRTFV